MGEWTVGRELESSSNDPYPELTDLLDWMTDERWQFLLGEIPKSNYDTLNTLVKSLATVELLFPRRKGWEALSHHRPIRDVSLQVMSEASSFSPEAIGHERVAIHMTRVIYLRLALPTALIQPQGTWRAMRRSIERQKLYQSDDLALALTARAVHTVLELPLPPLLDEQARDLQEKIPDYDLRMGFSEDVESLAKLAIINLDLVQRAPEVWDDAAEEIRAELERMTPFNSGLNLQAFIDLGNYAIARRGVERCPDGSWQLRPAPVTRTGPAPTPPDRRKVLV